MAYGMLLFAVYHVQFPLVVLHTLLCYIHWCICIGLTTCCVGQLTKGSVMRELDLSMESRMVWSWMSYSLSISCSSVIDFDTFTLCIYNIDYMSLSDSLQRVRRCIITMRNGLWYALECLTYLMSISWWSVIDCDTFTDVYALEWLLVVVKLLTKDLPL